MKFGVLMYTATKSPVCWPARVANVADEPPFTPWRWVAGVVPRMLRPEPWTSNRDAPEAFCSLALVIVTPVMVALKPVIVRTDGADDDLRDLLCSCTEHPLKAIRAAAKGPCLERFLEAPCRGRH